MKRNSIPWEQFRLRVCGYFDERWLVLTAGKHEPGGFNLMTVSWGGFGVMWGKPIAMVVVRPSRHTYGFMEKNDSFTLCGFPEKYRKELTLCGTRSGREINKVQECKWLPIPSTAIAAPGFDEAELIVECRKIYSDDFKPARFLAPEIEKNYNGRDYHRMYFGEILAIHGTEAFQE